MGLSGLGFIAIMAGLAVLALPAKWAATLMLTSTVFGAAAAFSVPGLGGASVLVPSMFLIFYAVRVFMAWGEGTSLGSFKKFGAGFWLLLLTTYGLVAAFFFPRLMEGVTDTMLVTRLVGGLSSISLIPLEPSGNNITQSVYAAGGLGCFAISVAYYRRPGALEDLYKAIIVLSIVNLSFAVIDVATWAVGAEFVLDFVHTANYAFLTAAEKGGLKRISGSFPEASAFAGFTLALFSVNASLWLDRVRPRVTGPVTAALLLALALSTSATAYVGLISMLGFLALRSLSAPVFGRKAQRPVLLVGLMVSAPVLLGIGIIVLPGVADTVGGFLDEMLFNKLDSQSGQERMMWNAVAYKTFQDTGWLGAGIGSARASSYLLVLLSNVGVPGLVLFALFLGAIAVVPSAAHVDEFGRSVVRAARAGVVAGMAEAMTSGTVYDLGLLFYVLAGAIAANQVELRASPQLPALGGPYGRRFASGSRRMDM
jgi:hypothetical protein